MDLVEEEEEVEEEGADEEEEEADEEEEGADEEEVDLAAVEETNFVAFIGEMMKT